VRKHLERFFWDVLRKYHGVRLLDVIPLRNRYVYGRHEIE
jgi:hypothetical protein